MAGSVHTFDTFIKSSYGIQVAARCSSDVEDICQKNYLSFCELLRPFSQLASECRVQDPQGHLYPVRNLRLRFTEPAVEALPSFKVDELLSDTVHWSERNALDGSPKEPMINVQNIVTPATTPWFDHYCETLTDNVGVMEHENVRHYVAVILVVSSRLHHPLETIQNLYRAQKESEHQPNSPHWIPLPHIFYYHVLVHDVLDGNPKHARECFDVLKRTYGGGNCYLLHVNSLDPTSQLNTGVPEPWSAFLRISSSPNERESVDFGFSRFNQKRHTVPSQSPQVVSKANSTTSTTRLHTSNSTSGQPPLKPDKMREEPNLEIDEQEKGEGTEEEGPEQSSSTVSVISSQVELGEDPLSGSDSGNMEEEERTVVGVGRCMSVEDQNTLRTFVKDFSNRLLSHLEAVLRKLNDALQSRRTVSRRMSSFSRGFIWKMMGGGSGTGGGGGGSSGGGGGPPASNGESQSLSADSIERQMRLVGDLAFLLHNYELAYNMHHTLKRDLQGRDLWIHYAGAHEMAALSAQMMGSSRKEIQSYLEEASSIYNHQLKLPNVGLRASIFICGILKSRQKYQELSSFLVKLTPDESDLRSALFFEQIAHAFLKFNPVGMIRKYALNLIFCAHYYNKAGQKAHSVRVYKLVSQVYRDNGWIIAEDFIQSITAKLCFALQRPQQALHSLENILSRESHQMVQNQLSCLRDYIHIRKVLMGQSNHDSATKDIVKPPWSSQTSEESLKNVPFLPIPFLESQNTTVIFNNGIPEPEKWITINQEFLKSLTSISFPKPSNQYPNKGGGDQRRSSNDQLIVGATPYVPCQLKLGENGWCRLEELCLTSEIEEKGITPAVLFMGNGGDNSRTPLCPINEPVTVEVSLKNPLAIALMLRHVSLIWKFEPMENQDSGEPGIVCEVLERFILPPKFEDKVSLWVVPIKPGSVEIKGLVYNLCMMEDDVLVQDDFDRTDLGALSSEGFQGKLEMLCQGLRLNDTKTERLGVVYGDDNRLCWKIIDPMPRAMMIISGLADDLVAGEVVPLTIKLINCSSVPVTNPKLSTSLQQYILFDDKKVSQESSRNYHTLTDTSSCHSVLSPSSSIPQCLTLPLQSGSLLPGEWEEYHLLFHVPQSSTSELPWNMVLYYEPLSTHANHSAMSHRVVRHCEVLSVQQCVHVKASIVPSVSSDQNIKQECDKLLISVDVANSSGLLGIPIQLKVLQISSISYSWQISNIAEANDYSCRNVLPGGEGVIHISASRTRDTSLNTLLFSDVSFVQTATISSCQFPVSDFYFGAASTKRPTSSSTKDLGEKILENEITMIIFWEADHIGVQQRSRTVYGHHYITVPLPQDIPMLKIQADSLALSPSVASITSYDLVKHTLCYSPCINHNFTKEGICTMSMSIQLENSTSEELVVSLELLVTAEVTFGTRSLEPSFHWSGPVKRLFLLSSLSKHSEHVYVNFSAPGIYNLDALRIKACYNNNTGSTKQHSNNVLCNQRWHTANYVIVKSIE